MKAEVTEAGVLLDGEKFRILSGEMHYFRIHPDSWRDRLEKLKACGLNTVSTYVPWNLHEPRPGEFEFAGFAGLAKFLRLAGELGLRAMVRPGPYICSEWEFGGLPGWLLAIPGIRLRCSNEAFLNCAERYFRRVFDEIEPLFSRHGGPVIAIQLENGYASYGNDPVYMERLKEWTLASGFDGILYTADGDSDTRITSQVPEGVWRTLMLGEKPLNGLGVLKRIQPGLPAMVSEFWNGQGIRQGVPLRLRDPRRIAADLETLLEAGAHVNLYMFHGGTTFGLMNGGLKLPPACRLEPFVGSYDTMAPLDEAGNPRELYYLFREIFARYNTPSPLCSAVPAASYGRVALTEQASLFENLPEPVRSPAPLAMEELGQETGMVLYRTHLAHQSFPLPVRIVEPRDRAWLFLNGRRVAFFGPNDGNCSCVLSIPEEGAELAILVENLGRFNFSWNLEENRKGITFGVILNNQQFQHGWEMFSLPLKETAALRYRPCEETPAGPLFFRGRFETETPEDTYLRVTSGHRGIAWINGFCLGRYENAGPQFSLYVPAGLLNRGGNTVEILELEGLAAPAVDFIDHPDWR